MSEVELILAALAAGAAAGASDTAGNVVRDAYQGLKGVLSRKLAERWGREPDVVLDAAETDPGMWEAALSSTEVAADAEVVQAARRVLVAAGATAGETATYSVDLRDAKGVQVGDGNTQHNTFG